MPRIAYDFSCHWTLKNIEQLSTLGYLCDLEEQDGYSAQIIVKSPYTPVPLQHYPELRIVASNTTSPWHIDLEYCKKEGIEVITLQGNSILQSIKSTAEHTCGLIYAAHRNIVSAHLETVNLEEWDRYQYGVPKELSESTLLVIGLGRIGSWVSEMMEHTMGTILAYDPEYTGVDDDLATYLCQADIVALCCSLTKSSTGIMGPENIELLPKGAIIVNTAQGGCLDTMALLDAMDAHHIQAAALDVLDEEFTGEITPTMQCVFAYAKENPNLILTPHIAGSTHTAWDKTQKAVIEALRERIEKWS